MDKFARFLIILVVIMFPEFAKSEEIYVKVELEGLQDELKENVNSFLSIKQLEKEKQLSIQKIKSAHRRAKNEIQQALQPYGYYQPIITSKLIEKDNIWNANYIVEIGPPTLIKYIEVHVEGEGKEENKLLQIVDNLPFAVGERLDHSKYKKLKKKLFAIAYSNGYLDAEFKKNEILVGRDNQQAEITLILDTGSRYYFGSVSIEQDVLSRRFVNRYIDIKESEPFDPDKLLNLKFILSDSGYFNNVEVIAQKEKHKDFHIPVLIKTQAKKPRKYSAGIGFGTDTGPRGNLGIEFRRFNKRGHKANINLRASAIKSEISSQYIIPIKDITKDQFAFTAAASEEEFADGDGDSETLSIGINHNTDWLKWRRKLYLNLEKDNFSIGDDREDTTLFFPGLTLSRSSADDTLYTRKGYSLSFDAHGGFEDTLSDTSFFNTRINTAAVLPLSKKGRLILRGQVGVVDAVDFNLLPPSQRFFAGGDRSVRGYNFQDIGPRDDSGENVGGKYLYTASVETDYLVYKKFGGAVFFDAGNAEDELTWDPQKGAGVGLRWASPVGMFRLDFAFPLDGDDRGLHFHISIGPDL